MTCSTFFFQSLGASITAENRVFAQSMAHGKAATALRTLCYVFWHSFFFLLIPRQAAVLTSRQGVAAL